MFGRKRRAASNPPQRAPAVPSTPASLAATTAFARDRESNGALPYAAAAQALRTHVTTPTPVGDTITKRMVRRNSTSSNGSGSHLPPGILRRQSSSGSMTERSFRAASPGRGSPADPNAPPVPPVPTHIPDSSVAHRRAASLEPISRGGSSAGHGRGRGASVDSRLQNQNQTSLARDQRPMGGLAHVTEEDSLQRSVNFSRPMSPALSGSRQSAASAGGNGWFSGPVVNQGAVQQMSSSPASRPRSSGGPSAFELHQTQQTIQNAADRPVKKHHVSYAVQGTSLSQGAMRAKPSGTAVQSRSFLPPATSYAPRAVDPNSPDAVYDPSTRTFIHKQDAMARHRELHHEPEQAPQQYVTQHVDNYRPRSPPQQPKQRSPAPVRQVVQQESLPTSQRSRETRPQPDATSVETKSKNVIKDARVEPTSMHASSQLTPAQDISQPPRIPSPVIPTPTNTLASQSHASARTGRERHMSLSPPRSAHFAPMAVELEGEKHQPPPRSSSPAKSALKSSPSPSRRGSSPIPPASHLFHKAAPSDVSDTASDDGLRKKRNMRVSFEETPIIAGTSAYADTNKPVSPTGLSASKWSPSAEEDDVFDDFMKPRAALPVFGSIREKERRSTHEDIAEKVTETVSSTPMTASIGSIGDSMQSSNDHALGSIVAQDFARKETMTSVERSGDASDSSRESSLYKHGDAQSPAPEPKTLTEPIEDKPSTPASVAERVIDVPDIALLPPTPGLPEGAEPTYDSMSALGGWDTVIPTQDAQTIKSAPTAMAKAPSIPIAATYDQSASQIDEDESSDDNSSVYSDAYEDLTDAEGGFGSIDAMVGSSVVLSQSGLKSSKYADKSATASPVSQLRHEATADTHANADATRSTADRQADARNVAARVMQAPITRDEPRDDRRSAAEPATKTVTPPHSSQSSPRPLKSALKKSLATQPAEPQMRTTLRGGASPVLRGEPPMRSTMRESHDIAPQAQPQMRKSMRGSDSAPSAHMGLATSPPQMRKSMRGSDPVSPGLAASRHSMVQMDTKPTRGALQKRNIPTAAPAPKPRPQSMPVSKPVAVPAPKYESDSDASESSFQRVRSSRNRNEGGRYTMRGSMRNGPAPTMRASAAPAPKPVRAISPPASPSPAMRKSLRPSSPTQEPAKSFKFRLRSLSPVGRFRSSKSPERAPPSPVQPKKMAMPTFSKQPKQTSATAARVKAAKASKASRSRFVDSSDEDDDEPPRRFQSRFADSDSDDGEEYKLPPGLAPVRGIPRRAGEEDGDSTDLEEEADHEKATAQATAGPSTNGKTNGNANGQGAALSGGSLRDSKHAPTLPTFEAGDKVKVKRSFFGLGKKKTMAASPVAAPTVAASPVAASPVAASPVAASPVAAPPVATPSEAAPSETAPQPSVPEPEQPSPPAQRNRPPGLPLTPIEEDKDFGTAVADSPESKKAPKLQRRSTPEWPLPSIAAVDDDKRPMSSDGIAPHRPRFAMRQPSTTSNATAPNVDAQGRTVSFGRDGKKKKFQGLRRVFGLND